MAANLFALGVLQKWGVTGLSDAEWWGVFDASDDLRGVCYAGSRVEHDGFGLVVPAGDEEAAHLLGVALASRGGAGWVIGERGPSDALWSGLGSPPARLRSDQVLFETQALRGKDTIELRKAHDGDFGWLHAAASAMVQEDLSLPWAGQSSAAFAARLRSSIREGSEYIGTHHKRLVYRAERGTHSTYGAQIGGIWVDPEYRSQGLGKAGTRAVSAALLGEVPRVTLHVRADNRPAIRCYESIGFTPIRAFRLWVR